MSALPASKVASQVLFRDLKTCGQTLDHDGELRAV
jgi:hypothetical protein